MRETDHLEDTGVDERILLRFFFRNWDVRTWTGLVWFGIGKGGGYS
jgi:hypothetical protein